MPDVAGGWLCSLLRTLGGIFGREISYLGVAGLDTPIWDVLAPQGEQKRALNCLTMRPRSPAFPIRQVVPVGIACVQFCCWARWARLSTIETMYIASYTIYTHDMIFFIHWGRQEWVDASGWVWMTFSFRNTILSCVLSQ